MPTAGRAAHHLRRHGHQRGLRDRTAVVNGAGSLDLDKLVRRGHHSSNRNSAAAWQKTPSRVRVYSSPAVLGGSSTATILLK
jgi:hypothetical protein